MNQTNMWCVSTACMVEQSVLRFASNDFSSDSHCSLKVRKRPKLFTAVLYSSWVTVFGGQTEEKPLLQLIGWHHTSSVFAIFSCCYLFFIWVNEHNHVPLVWQRVEFLLRVTQWLFVDYEFSQAPRTTAAYTHTKKKSILDKLHIWEIPSRKIKRQTGEEGEE